MIVSFADTTTEKIWRREHTPRINLELHKATHRKLLLLDWAGNVNDLRVPPGNRLEKLAGDRKGQYSIRVNDQYRICFRWTAAGPVDVELTDYH